MSAESSRTARWYSLPLGDGLMASEPSNRIAEAFQEAFEAAGQPADMAVFTSYDAEGGLHCGVTAFFSPAAGGLAESFEARPCARPARAGLGLLAGDERAWVLLFPEAQS
jgi:hypothetical protein